MTRPRDAQVAPGHNQIRDTRQWFVDYLPVTGGNSVELLVDGESYGRALAIAIQGARTEVLLTGLHFMKDWRLTREGTSGLSLSDALLSCAQRGVEIRLIVNQFWDRDPNEHRLRDFIAPVPALESVDLTARTYITHEGGLAAYLPETAALFEELSRVQGIRCKTDVLDTAIMATHHQKTVIIDGRIAFVGGIDLTFVDGDRWDRPAHRIPSEPAQLAERAFTRAEHLWHDVHCRIEGPAVKFVLDNFHGRWNHGRFWAGHRRIGSRIERHRVDPEPNVMLRLGSLEAALAGAPAAYQERTIDAEAVRVHTRSQEGTTSYRVRELAPMQVQVVRSMPRPDYVIAQKKPPWNLASHNWEKSCRDAYLVGIRAARRYIYLENQWIADEDIWNALKEALRRNRGNRQFRVVLVLPRRPLAAAGAGRDQDIDLLPHVAESIELGLVHTEFHQNAFMPRPAFGMYCPVQVIPPGTDVALSEDDRNEFRSDESQIYIHSKVMIVDDEWSLIGSANAGGISLTGAVAVQDPDTELSVIVKDAGFARNFRETLWSEHLERSVSGMTVHAAADALFDRAYAARSVVYFDYDKVGQRSPQASSLARLNQESPNLTTSRLRYHTLYMRGWGLRPLPLRPPFDAFRLQPRSQ